MPDQDEQPDWYKYTLDLPMAQDPGVEHAVYCTGGINLPHATPVLALPSEWIMSTVTEE